LARLANGRRKGSLAQRLTSVAEITDNAARYDQATLGAIQCAAAWLGIETEPTWPQLRQLLFERVGVTRLLGSTAAVVLGLVGSQLDEDGRGDAA